MNKLKKIIIMTFILFFLINKSFAVNETIYDKIDLFSEVLKKINKEYVDEVNQNKIMN